MNLSDNTIKRISYFFAGTFAGGSGILVGHPFDTLKVRYQLGKAISIPLQLPQNVSSTSSSSMSMMFQFRELYRGILPPLLTAGIMQSINFSLYEHFKGYWKTNWNFTHLQAVFLGGTMSGTLISLITSPIACVKIQQQIMTRKGIIDCSKSMYTNYGIKSFYKGFGPFFIMESFGRGIYLWVYESTKLLLRSNGGTTKDLKEETLGIRMISAANAGCTSWLVVYPLDVIKSRLQVDITGAAYSSFTDCANKIFKEYGFKGFFRGLTFTMIRAAPVASTILPVYEFAREYIEKLLR